MGPPARMIVSTQKELDRLAERLASAGSFALDTEFVHERTFRPRLGTVQVAIEGLEAVIDPHSVESLEPIERLISDPETQKIVHAGRHDFEIMFDRTGLAPRNVFDTQVAAALVGYGAQVSYAALVKRIAHRSLAKTETRTDWTRRPLSAEQIRYALDDVRYLGAIRDHLTDRLSTLGRAQWASEEFTALEEATLYGPPEPREYYLRLKHSTLGPEKVAVLRELAAWREREAAGRDMPRVQLVRDEVLLQMARRPPGTLDELKKFRFPRRGTAAREGGAMLEAIRRAQAGPLPERETEKRDRRNGTHDDALTRLLDTFLRARAIDAEIAPELLATRAQLERLTRGRQADPLPELAVLTGWRRGFIGEDLLALLRGELKIGVDPSSGRLTIERSKRK